MRWSRQPRISHYRNTGYTTIPDHSKGSGTVGPIYPLSLRGHPHVLIFIDIASDFCPTVPIASRAVEQHVILRTVLKICNHLIRVFCSFHPKNTKLYSSRFVHVIILSTGINQSTTIPCQPQLKALARRISHTRFNAARSTVISSSPNVTGKLLYWRLCLNWIIWHTLSQASHHSREVITQQGVLKYFCVLEQRGQFHGHRSLLPKFNLLLKRRGPCSRLRMEHWLYNIWRTI